MVSRTSRPAIAWPAVLALAAELVEASPLLIGLRRLHYLLVVALAPPAYFNDQSAYRELGRRTAELRRQGRFPHLIDASRQIDWGPMTWTSADDGRDWLRGQYLHERLDTQDVQLWLATEKRGDAADLAEWFFPDYTGLAIVPLGGDHSEPLERDVVAAVRRDGRPAVLGISGDCDAKGGRIRHNFVRRTGCWDHVHEIALTARQVRRLDLPVAMRSPYATQGRFVSEWAAAHGGANVQVELQAYPAALLKRRTEAFIRLHLDRAAYDDALADEEAERRCLTPALDGEDR
jgi:hypothetical protein